ncbi:unnamed protein product [Meloidogyne enterolobii]|uniref:Uncharacterized protein n=1 Tax=Meloidogyne enterolobii TaxID=390850 RepID=A0ACB1A6K7_MELEN
MIILGGLELFRNKKIFGNRNFETSRNGARLPARPSFPSPPACPFRPSCPSSPYPSLPFHPNYYLITIPRKNTAPAVYLKDPY